MNGENMIDNAIVIGFKKAWEDDNTISYHVIKLNNSGGKKDFIEFPIDKQPDMFGTIKIDVVNGYNIPTSIPSNTRTTESVKSKMYNFIAENYPQAEEPDPTDAVQLPKIEGCYIEGIVISLTNFGKMVVGMNNGQRMVVYAHDLLKHTDVSKGDKVRLVGDLKVDTNQLYAYVIGCLPYIREEKPKEESKNENKSDESVKKGIDDCEETQKPPKQTPPENNGNGSNSNGRSNKYAPTITKEGYEISDEGMHFIASMFKDKYHIKVLEASTFAMEDILVFKDGYYQRNGEKILRKELKDILGVEYTIGWYNTMYQHLKAMEYPINRSDFLQRPCTTNLLNGIFDYSSGKVEFIARKYPNDFWDYNFDYIIPINYDPDATCPDIDEMLYKILVDRIERGFTDEELMKPSPELYQQIMDTPSLKEQWDKELELYTNRILSKKGIAIENGIITPCDPEYKKLWLFHDYLGSCLMSELIIKRAVALVGKPHTAKTTLLNIVRQFIGKKNVCSVSIQNMDSSTNRFSAATMDGKLSNICDEIPAVSPKNIETFKAATGGSEMPAENKGKAFFQMLVRAHMIMAANETFKVDPKIINSFFSRIVVIECLNVFEGNTKNSRKINKIYSDKELSGLLNHAKLGLERLLELQDYDVDDEESISIWSKYIEPENLAQSFLEAMCSFDTKAEISKKELHKEYLKYCKDNHLTSIISSDKEFSKAVSQYASYKGYKLASTQPMTHGVREYYFEGIGLNRLFISPDYKFGMFQ
jgi:putative DNA primase/helicase